MSQPPARRRNHLIVIFATYALVLLCSLIVSETWNLNFRHPQWRMKDLKVLFDDAGRNGTDVVYLGTSQMMVGIVPPAVEEAYVRLRPGESLRGHNLGIEACDWTMLYATLRRYLATTARRPRVAVVEVGMIDTDQNQHRLMRNVTRPLDLPAFRREWAILPRIELALSVLGRGPQDLLASVLCSAEPGHDVQAAGGWVPQQQALPSLLRNKENLTGIPLEQILKRRASMGRGNLEVSAMPTRMLERVAAACRSHGVRLVLLHVPQFKERRLSQQRLEFFLTQGEVLEPDYPRLYQPELYHESVHMNEAGARELSRQVGTWLAGARWPGVEEWLAEQ